MNGWTELIDFPALILTDSYQELASAARDLYDAGLITAQKLTLLNESPPYCIYVDGKGHWFWTDINYFASSPDSGDAKIAMRATKYVYPEIRKEINVAETNVAEMFKLFNTLI